MRGRIWLALLLLLAALPLWAQEVDPEDMRRELLELSQQIEQVYRSWQKEKDPAKKQHYWEVLVKRIVTYNEKRQEFEKRTAEQEKSFSFPPEALDMLREIRDLERQIFRTQDALNRAIQEYQQLARDAPPPRVRIKEMQILKLRAQKDKIIEEYDKKLKEFKKKFPELVQPSGEEAQKPPES